MNPNVRGHSSASQCYLGPGRRPNSTMRVFDCVSSDAQECEDEASGVPAPQYL